MKRILISCLLATAVHGTWASRWNPSSLSVTSFRRPNQVVESMSSPTPLAFKHAESIFGPSRNSFCSVSNVSNYRGGASPPSSPDMTTFYQTIESIVNVLVGVGRTILPPVFEVTRMIFGFYRSLPKDVIVAQAGLVYCFAGGYYPTLFAALSAAQNCGWDIMVQACEDLTEQAILAIDAVTGDPRYRYDREEMSYQERITQTTMIVLKTIDPVKINTAASALYTTWLGVSTVLQREFARTITLSLTIAGYLRPFAQTVLGPPLYFCIPDDFHKWVPVLLGWACKATAMSVAWRVQRVLTATTSAITGGLMFARALLRIWNKRNTPSRSRAKRAMGRVLRENHEETFVDEILGLMVAGVGLYTQIGHGFDFKVPFPLSLVSWPFDIAEHWIQWQITKELEP